MAMSDVISDMLTRIRNGQKSNLLEVDVRYSKNKLGILEVLLDEGYITNYEKLGSDKPIIRIYLKYTISGIPVIQEIKRVSKPGRRVYSPVKALKRNNEGLGIYILSTSRGIISDRVARQNLLGGEVICSVF